MESALDRARRLEQEAKKNREKMPETAKILDHWREAFGSVSIVHSSEGGRQMGRLDLSRYVQASVKHNQEEKKDGKSSVGVSRGRRSGNRSVLLDFK